MRIKKLFFDRQVVISAVDKVKRKILSRIGAFVRTAARSSIRKRKGVSKPGQPPHSHTGLLKRFIFFGYDPSADSVVIGPAKTNQIFFDKNRKPVKGTVPQALEFGGQVTILESEVIPGYWRRADLRSRRRIAESPQRWRTVAILPRPYMGPALQKEKSKLPPMWAGSVKG